MTFNHLIFVWLLATCVRAGGFVGYGIPMYQPPCAWGCQNSVTAPLNCTGTDMGTSMVMKRMAGMGGGSSSDLPSGDGWMVMKPTPECRADNDFYLETVAFCIQAHCADVSLAELEAFWAGQVVNSKPDLPLPKKSYLQTLSRIVEPPKQQLNNSVLLNYTAIVDSEAWSRNYKTVANFANTEKTHARYGLVVFLAGVILPIGVSLLRFVPWPAFLVMRFRAYFIDPPLIGANHSVPIWGLGIMPTRGQTLFISYIWIINIVLSAVGFKTVWPHLWYSTHSQEVETYVGNRLGLLSFANFPLAILYAGRNNVLLWLTNWSHSTFLLLHRWISFICMLQAVLHSIIYLNLYMVIQDLDYSTESQKPYWYWGIIGTLALVLLVVASIQRIRQKAYEAFLASHIVLSILAWIGCYLHIWYRFQHKWGYETWLHMAIAIWAFDRVLRLVRSMFGGTKRAYITDIDDDYIRIDIPGVTASGHIYLHFPTVSNWRVWENHPFSVAGLTHRTHPRTQTSSVGPGADKTLSEVVSKSLTEVANNSSDTNSQEQGPRPEAKDIGAVLFVRKHRGITLSISANRSGDTGLPVLVEGSYHGDVTMLQGGQVRQTQAFPNVIFIAGGVGITAVLPILDQCSGMMKDVIGSRKLYWGVRTMPLVHAVEAFLGYQRNDTENSRCWAGTNVTLSVGERLNLRSLLESDLGSQKGARQSLFAALLAWLMRFAA
ncbi:Ferric/cupric reductase transmembrane component B-like protein [Cladobotryum mycophilum]|uniref:Ferric/cupric reductase transmembrane component B-like protein n=1 Tax=Cladobotryum mycophilum TaxID=491253 RepID=A0ABR0SEY9_9HYPO